MSTRRSFLRLFSAVTLALGFSSFSHAASAKDDDRPVEDATKFTLEQKATENLPTLWIIGDSTVKVGTPGQRGWGEVITPFFDTTKINVVNRAIGGRSSRTFLTDGRWYDILKDIQAGDYVLMQFGHNDSGPLFEELPINKSTRCRGTIRGIGDETESGYNILTKKRELVHSYGWYMNYYVTTARAHGAIPIVCTLVPRKGWDAEGHARRDGTTYALWARQVAEKAHAPLVDLNEIIARAYEKIGPDKVNALFADAHTHATEEGARFNARAVISGLNGMGSDNPLAPYLSEAGQEVAPYQP